MTHPGTSGLEAAYRKYFPMIQEKCTRILGSAGDAQDVAQETFVRLWQQQDELRAPEAAVAWIYKTATHLAIDKLRARKHETLMEADVAGGENLEGQSHARAVLQRLARDLPADELAVAVLARVDGLNQQEVASVMGISERTVRRLLQRLDERLSAQWGPQGALA